MPGNRLAMKITKAKWKQTKIELLERSKKERYRQEKNTFLLSNWIGCSVRWLQMNWNQFNNKKTASAIWPLTIDHWPMTIMCHIMLYAWTTDSDIEYSQSFCFERNSTFHTVKSMRFHRNRLPIGNHVKIVNFSRLNHRIERWAHWIASLWLYRTMKSPTFFRIHSSNGKNSLFWKFRSMNCILNRLIQ